MICPKCGNNLSDTASFCPGCGAPVVRAQQPAAPTQQFAAPTQQPAAPTQQPAAPTQQFAAPTQQFAAPTQQFAAPTQKPNSMQVLSMIWGIVAILGMVVGFIPCLGWLNWLNIPLSGVGIIISGITLGTTKEGSKGGSITGLICCIIALFFGIIRLILGGGVL